MYRTILFFPQDIEAWHKLSKATLALQLYWGLFGRVLKSKCLDQLTKKRPVGDKTLSLLIYHANLNLYKSGQYEARFQQHAKVPNIRITLISWKVNLMRLQMLSPKSRFHISSYMSSKQSTLCINPPSLSPPCPLHLQPFVTSIWDNLPLVPPSNQNPFPCIVLWSVFLGHYTCLFSITYHIN